MKDKAYKYGFIGSLMKSVAFIISVVLLFMAAVVVAESPCAAKVSLLNQDPIPAVPGEELEVVFMLENIDSRNCGEITFEVMDEYPFEVIGQKKVYNIQSGTYTKDRNTYKTIPVDFFVNKEAIDGGQPLEVRFRSSESRSQGYFSETFDIDVKDVRADFEVFVSDYDYSTKEMTFEVLNIADADIEAVTVEVVDQKNVKVAGANKENIGDLSSNEDTSAEFKMDVQGEEIELKISYSDSINVRRSIVKKVQFDHSLFESTKKGEEKDYTWYIVAGVVVLVLIFLFFRKRKKKKKK